jgi:outer membrane protein assembly factor BamA
MNFQRPARSFGFTDFAMAAIWTDTYCEPLTYAQLGHSDSRRFRWPSYTQCQQTSQSNNVSYEGQKVATVELVANPKISVESLRSLVQQRADEPYSSSKVADTISALEGTGRFFAKLNSRRPSHKNPNPSS